MQDQIIVKGARVNNLKNIDVTIPRDKLVVMTGLSGSGKSSLAFDTIYAEGQRRYVESLSSYARMFLGQMDKPDVDYIEGLSMFTGADHDDNLTAEELSAAAVTRGIENPAPKTSMIEMKFGVQDFLCLTAGLIFCVISITVG